MTDAEYAPVLALAATLDDKGRPIGESEAMRRLIESGAISMGLRPPPKPP